MGRRQRSRRILPSSRHISARGKTCMRRVASPTSPSMEITKDLTLPKLLLRTALKYGPRKIAMREKEFGIWRPITWQEYLERVKALALGFVALGLGRGDKVALIGQNRPEGLW